MLLTDVFERLKKFTNGERVGRRVTQLFMLALDPQYEHLIPSVNRVLNTIQGLEGQLLQRSELEMVTEGRILPEFDLAVRKSSDAEWEQFKSKLAIDPFVGKELTRLFADASGLVRNTGFEDWVLGNDSQPIDPETSMHKAQILGSKEL